MTVCLFIFDQYLNPRISLKENFLKTLDGVLWVCDLVSNGSWILVDLMIITTLVALVSIEVNSVIVFLNVLKAETLVPSLWEHIK